MPASPTPTPRDPLTRAILALVRLEIEATPTGGPSRWMRVTDSPEPELARRWISSGELPSCRPGKHRLCDRAIHDRLCELHSRARQAPPGASVATDAPDETDLYDARILAAGGRR